MYYFMKKFSLKLVFLNPFVVITMMFQGLANKYNYLLEIQIFTCAPILQHNDKLGHKPSSIAKFHYKMFSI
jgi:hypothetical protein